MLLYCPKCNNLVVNGFDEIIAGDRFELTLRCPKCQQNTKIKVRSMVFIEIENDRYIDGRKVGTNPGQVASLLDL